MTYVKSLKKALAQTPEFWQGLDAAHTSSDTSPGSMFAASAGGSSVFSPCDVSFALKNGTNCPFSLTSYKIKGLKSSIGYSLDHWVSNRFLIWSNNGSISRVIVDTAMPFTERMVWILYFLLSILDGPWRFQILSTSTTCDNSMHGFLKECSPSHIAVWVPLFWISGIVSSGVQSQSRFCLIHFFAEANVKKDICPPKTLKNFFF